MVGALSQDRGDLLERDPEGFVEDDDERDRLGTEVHRGGAERVGGLQRMPALHALATRRTAPDLDVEPPHDRTYRGQVLLILRCDARQVGRATTARTRRREGSRVGLIDARRNRPSGSAAAGGAASPPRSPATSLRVFLRQRRGLAEARPTRRVQLLLEALVPALQPIALAPGHAPLLLRACHLVTQARDLVLLALDQTSRSSRVGRVRSSGTLALCHIVATSPSTLFLDLVRPRVRSR
jgi:hypothetical protein